MSIRSCNPTHCSLLSRNWCTCCISIVDRHRCRKEYFQWRLGHSLDGSGDSVPSLEFKLTIMKWFTPGHSTMRLWKSIARIARGLAPTSWADPELLPMNIICPPPHHPSTPTKKWTFTFMNIKHILAYMRLLNAHSSRHTAHGTIMQSTLYTKYGPRTGQVRRLAWRSARYVGGRGIVTPPLWCLLTPPTFSLTPLL